ncbi:MAG: DUF4214 domain-containing protein [Hoeflea sp.]|nr:DUF4214 domain-containing protein [Hoeflea sp.]
MGASLGAMANFFIGSPEFMTLYGEAPSNEEFTAALYANVLNRTPRRGGLSILERTAVGRQNPPRYACVIFGKRRKHRQHRM